MDSTEDGLDVDCDAHHLCNMRRRLQQVPVPPHPSLSTPCPAPKHCLEMFVLVVQILDPCNVVDLGSKHGSEVRRGSGKYEFVTAELWAIISSHLGPGVEYEFLRTSLAALLAAIYLHMWD